MVFKRGGSWPQGANIEVICIQGEVMGLRRFRSSYGRLSGVTGSSTLVVQLFVSEGIGVSPLDFGAIRCDSELVG